MGIKVNRDEFWELYRKSFGVYGAVTQDTVDALNDILDRFETEKRLKFVSHYAYVLATSFHETGLGGHHFKPVKEKRERTNSPRRANQDRYWVTGFYGRGHVQTTWEDNYRKLGKALGVGEMFVQNPDLLLTAKWSYESLVYGLSAGMYRKDASGPKKLGRYLKKDDASVEDYVRARDCVNGDIAKNGLLIANHAEKFENILFRSMAISIASGNPAASSPESASDNEIDPPSVGTPSITQTADTIVNTGNSTDPASTTTIPMEPPVKEGASASAAKATILGFTVPVGVVTVIESIQGLVRDGYLDAKEIASTVVRLIIDNQKYVLMLIGAYIGLLIVKKIGKQVTFWLSMLTAAVPSWNTVVVPPSSEPARAKWWRYGSR